MVCVRNAGVNILLANQPIRFGPLKFRGVQIILYQLHQTLLSAFFLLNFFYASRGSGHETSLWYAQGGVFKLMVSF